MRYGHTGGVGAKQGWRTELRRVLRTSPYNDDTTTVREMIRDYPKEYDPIGWRLVPEDEHTPGQGWTYPVTVIEFLVEGPITHDLHTELIAHF